MAVRGHDQLIRETIEFWREHGGHELTEEDARDVVENIVGFFKVLKEWGEAMGGGGAEGEARDDEKQG